MGRPRRVHCRICDRHVSKCGELSARGKCERCAVDRVLANVRELRAHTGPALRAWRHGVARGVGAVLLDDLEPDTQPPN